MSAPAHLELATDAPRERLRECPDCGLVQRVPAVPPGAVARCVRCDATLARRALAGLGAAAACVASAAVIAPFAVVMPLISLREMGRLARATLFTGPNQIARDGLWALAALVIGVLVVAPAIEIALGLGVALCAGDARRARWTRRGLAWSHRVAPYAMVDVFLLGFLVAYSRLAQIAHVVIGPSFYAAVGVTLALVGAHTALSPEGDWALPSARVAARGARKRHSVLVTWILVGTGLVLYIPANVLPMMYIEHLGQTTKSTILGGVVALAGAGAWPLAVLVFVASITIPLLKLVALAVMLVMTRVPAPRALRTATRVHRVVDLFGRWSMLDIFALTTLVGLVHIGRIASVRPGEAALPFCVVVIVTMLATELFDTRLIWDAADARAREDEERRR